MSVNVWVVLNSEIYCNLFDGFLKNKKALKLKHLTSQISHICSRPCKTVDSLSICNFKAREYVDCIALIKVVMVEIISV